MDSNSHYQQKPEDAENNYSLLGIEEYNITGRLAETNDDYADHDEEGEGWDQYFHVIEGSAMTEEGDGL